MASPSACILRSIQRRLLPRAERQEVILRGAAHAFAVTGFNATSMDDVAAASGITRLILYRHFSGKSDLYRAVLLRVTERLEQEFKARRRRCGDERGIGLRALLAVSREDPDGFRLLWRHAAREPEFAALAADERARAVEIARTFVAQSPLDPELTEWAAQVIVSYLVDAVLQWLDYGSPERDEKFLDLVTGGLSALSGAWVHERSGTSARQRPAYSRRAGP
jgi:AcrR family transcriptional regulator